MCICMYREREYYQRRCGAMEVQNGAARPRAMEMEVASSSPSKRRKVDDSQLRSSPKNSVSVSPAAILDSSPTPATSFSSSQNNSTSTVQDSSRSLDLNAKAEGFETDLSTFFIGAFRETTPLSELCGDSEKMESSPVKKKKTLPAPLNSKRKPSTAKMPSAAEIEEFFSVAEKYEQKRFAEKYNYDIVRDVPLEGRYQWVRLKP